jgi:hypothetical protein
MTATFISRATAATAAALLVCTVALPASAQSLADAAEKEAARRKALKGPVKIVTNEDLRPVPAAPPSTAAPSAASAAGEAQPPVPAAEPAEHAAPAAEAPAEAAGAGEPAGAGSGQGEAYWRQRITLALQQRDQNAFLIEAVQTRINALTADFSARDDPFQRAKIGEARQRTLDELDRMKRNQVALEKQVADIQEEARRANVPPGWLR